MKKIFSYMLILCSCLSFTPGFGQTQKMEHTVMVGGAPMYPSKNIIENAVHSKDHTTLVAAV
ncbi:MAG: fasciclin domain-containing protein, partial [Bacteroidota bacterium]|nr:fasciclin domain-containing protein [Bacteroidota bacterium]